MTTPETPEQSDPEEIALPAGINLDDLSLPAGMALEDTTPAELRVGLKVTIGLMILIFLVTLACVVGALFGIPASDDFAVDESVDMQAYAEALRDWQLGLKDLLIGSLSLFVPVLASLLGYLFGAKAARVSPQNAGETIE